MAGLDSEHLFASLSYPPFSPFRPRRADIHRVEYYRLCYRTKPKSLPQSVQSRTCFCTFFRDFQYVNRALHPWKAGR